MEKLARLIEIGKGRGKMIQNVEQHRSAFQRSSMEGLVKVRLFYPDRSCPGCIFCDAGTCVATGPTLDEEL
jgi:hypothetical protein